MTREKKTYYLIYTFFVVFFLAISFVAYYNYTDQKITYAEQFNKSQLQIINQIAGGIQEFISTEKRELEIFSKLPSLQNGSDTEKIRDMLAFYRLKQSEVSTIRIYDRSGVLLFALPSKTYRSKINLTFANTAFFKYAQNKNLWDEKKIYASNVHVDDVGERVITLSIPLFSAIDRDAYSITPAEFNGAIAVTIKMKRVEELFIESVKMGRESYVWAIDNRGEIIIHSDMPELIGRNNNNEFRIKGYKNLYNLTLSMLAQESGKGVYEYKKVENYTAYTPVIVGWKNFWSVAIATPIHVVQKINKKNFRNNITIVALLLTLFFITNFFINALFKKFMQISFEKEVSEKKREAEKKYRLLFENAANMIFIANKNGYEVKSFNKRFLKELGLNEDELTNFSLLDLLDETNQKIFITNFKEALSGKNANYELIIKNKKLDSEKIFSITNTLIEDNGEPQEVQCIGIDITDKKILSDELIEAKNKLQSVFDGMRMGISLITKDYDIVMVNKFQAKLFKKTPDDLAGNKCYSAFRKSNAICENCPAVLTLNGKCPNKTEVKIKSSSKKEKYYNLFTYPIYDAKDEVAGFISSVQDITMMKMMEFEINAKDEELAIINAISQSLSSDSADLALILKLTLAKILEALGYSGGIIFLNDFENKKMVHRAIMDVPIDFVNKMIELWGSEEFINDFINNKSSVYIEKIKNQHNVSYDLKNLFENEGIKQLTLLPVKVKDNIIGVITLFDKKSAKSKTHTAWLLDTIGKEIGITVDNCSLCSRLTASTGDLKKAQKMTVERERLEAANELAGATAHELTQPLTTIMSYSEFLMNDTAEDSNTYQTLKVISEEAARMSGIIKKIASVTKYETKKYITNTKIISIEKTTKED